MSINLSKESVFRDKQPFEIRGLPGDFEKVSTLEGARRIVEEKYPHALQKFDEAVQEFGIKAGKQYEPTLWVAVFWAVCVTLGYTFFDGSKEPIEQKRDSSQNWWED